MARADAGRRARSLLVAVVLGHVLLISSQVATPGGPSVLRTTVVAAVTALQEASWHVAAGVHAVWDGYAALRDAREENARLAGQITTLRVELQQARANAAGAEAMRALLGLRAHLPWSTTGADVVAGSLSPDFRSITIDKGVHDGVRQDMPVLNAAGVLGRVSRAAAGTSTVQFIIDRSAAAAVRTERTRSEGIALGSGDGLLRLEYLSDAAEIALHDTVVTAGIDGIYPPNLPVGRITEIQRSGTTYRRVVITPFADFERLETVLVLVSPPAAAPEPVAAPDGRVAR